jgi:hypothetical protein
MPLLYGEGKRAFQRLQEELLRKYGNFSLLVWRGNNTPSSALLAPSPECFHSSSYIEFSVMDLMTLSSTPLKMKFSDQIRRLGAIPPPSITSRGLQVHLPLVWTSMETFERESNVYLAAVCTLLGERLVCIPLTKSWSLEECYMRYSINSPWHKGTRYQSQSLFAISPKKRSENSVSMKPFCNGVKSRLICSHGMPKG